jgi:hypothetical protein
MADEQIARLNETVASIEQKMHVCLEYIYGYYQITDEELENTCGG